MGGGNRMILFLINLNKRRDVIFPIQSGIFFKLLKLKSIVSRFFNLHKDFGIYFNSFPIKSNSFKELRESIELGIISR